MLDAAMTRGGATIDEEELRAKFDQIDSSGDGSLDEAELAQVFEAMGVCDLHYSFVPNLVRLVDEDGNGTIEWEEFLKIFKVLRKMKEKKRLKEEAQQQQQRQTKGVIEQAA